MAKHRTSRDYARESDPDFNRQFRRRWTEPPQRERGMEAELRKGVKRHEEED